MHGLAVNKSKLPAHIYRHSPVLMETVVITQFCTVDRKQFNDANWNNRKG